MKKKDFGVGSPIWHFDENRRKYRRGQSGPIWRAHWVKLVVIGENRVSWFVGYAGSADYMHARVSKKDLASGSLARHWATSTREIADAAWVRDNRFAISQAVLLGVHDRPTLARIAEIVGYGEKKV